MIRRCLGPSVRDVDIRTQSDRRVAGRLDGVVSNQVVVEAADVVGHGHRGFSGVDDRKGTLRLEVVGRSVVVVERVKLVGVENVANEATLIVRWFSWWTFWCERQKRKINLKKKSSPSQLKSAYLKSKQATTTIIDLYLK